MTTYLALLRGINVGGNNIIKMTELKTLFETLGYTNVTTYIQSGNVLFTTNKQSTEQLVQSIEAALTKQFKKSIPVVVISADQLRDVVQSAPKGFGSQPDQYRYDVLFVKPPLTAAAARKELSIKDGVDQVWAGTHVLYFSRLIAKATQSHLNKIVGQPIYKNITIRNWNTTTKLLARLV